MTIREMAFEPHQIEPLAILQAGISRRTDSEDGFFVSFLVDIGDRKDILDAIDAHRSGAEGDCRMVWWSAPDDDTHFNLLLEFQTPVTTKLVLSFDRVRLGPIVDILIDGRSTVSLYPGTTGDKLSELIAGQADGLTMHVTATVARDRWEEVWHQALVTKLDVSDEDATNILRMEQTDVRLRASFPDMPPLDRLAGMFVDREENKIVFFTRDILTNRLHRDGPRVIESFDRFFDAEVSELSDVVSRLSADVIPALIVASNSGDHLRWNCGQLIGNALGTTVAAIELVRLGHRLQPGILLRSAVEMVSTAAHLYQNPEDIGRFLAGSLDSTKSLKEAKKVIPSIGELYGHLSREFTHVSQLHTRIQESQEYESADDAAAKTNLLTIHVALFHIWVISELVFFDSIAKPQFWRQIRPGEFLLDVDSRVRNRMDKLLGRLSVGESAEESE